jgi:hypothetical protein
LHLVVFRVVIASEAKQSPIMRLPRGLATLRDDSVKPR